MAEITLLKGSGSGKVNEAERQELGIERMLIGFLQALLDEQSQSDFGPESQVRVGGQA